MRRKLCVGMLAITLVAVIVAWNKSTADPLYFHAKPTEDIRVGVVSHNGLFQVCVTSFSQRFSTTPSWGIGHSTFGVYLGPVKDGGVYSVVISLAAVVLTVFLATLLAVCLVAPWYLGRRRRKRGLCIKCAYALTGNVSGVCPECGEKV